MADTTPQLAKSNLPKTRTVAGWTIVFMVLLRMAIGWHLFYEGAWKLSQDDWRATGFLVQSAGPLQDVFRKMVPDESGEDALKKEAALAHLHKTRDTMLEMYKPTDYQEKQIAIEVEAKEWYVKELFGTAKDRVANYEQFGTELHEIGKQLRELQAGAPGKLDPLVSKRNELSAALDAKRSERAGLAESDGRASQVLDGQIDQLVTEVNAVQAKIDEIQQPIDLLNQRRTMLFNAIGGFTHALSQRGDGAVVSMLDDYSRTLNPILKLADEKRHLVEKTDDPATADVNEAELDDAARQARIEAIDRELPTLQVKLAGQREKLIPLVGDSEFLVKVDFYKELLERLKEEHDKQKQGRADFKQERLQDLRGRKASLKNELLAKAYAGSTDLPTITGIGAGRFLNQDQLAAGAVPPDPSKTKWIDWANMIGLTVAGGFLLLGFLTRIAALGGAGLLVMYYLAYPPWPGVPANPMDASHYLFIDTKVIEVIALLMIATSRVGRWAGLDAYFFSGSSKGEKE